MLHHGWYRVFNEFIINIDITSKIIIFEILLTTFEVNVNLQGKWGSIEN